MIKKITTKKKYYYVKNLKIDVNDVDFSRDKRQKKKNQENSLATILLYEVNNNKFKSEMNKIGKIKMQQARNELWFHKSSKWIFHTHFQKC